MKSGIVAAITLAILSLLSGNAASAANYYIDSNSGNDTSSGRSSGAAWRTLEAVNRVVFKPGDRILLAAGSRYTGQLAPMGSGTRDAPITIEVYGGNQKARIDGQGQTEAPLLLRNIEHWEVGSRERPDRPGYAEGVSIEKRLPLHWRCHSDTW